jgi:Holliday junction resolvase RusA-like endonuclease
MAAAASRRHQQQAGWRVEPMVEVLGRAGSSLSFTMIGDPPVQRRPRIAWRGLLGGIWRMNRRLLGPRSMPIIYDPSAVDKARYSAAVVAALAELGLSDDLPYFREGVPLKLEVKFLCPRPIHAVQAFPTRKDLDNMVKFVMDACHDVLYTNDTVIVKITAEKAFPPVGSVGAWTEVLIGTI